MSNALITGVTGLRVNQDMLDVVGNNLANSNTTGYKSQNMKFSDLVYQTITQATGSTATTGGTDPQQIGLGAQVASISSDLTQGSLQSTGNDLDMALQGSGYFVVQNGNDTKYTRAGSFSVDANNNLIDPATGAEVQRFGTVGEGAGATPAFQTTGNDNIHIPIGTSIPGTATANVFLQGNLSAAAVGPRAQTLTTTQAYTTGSPAVPATLATTLNSLADNVAPYAATDNIVLQGINAAGATVNVTVPVGPTTTLGDLVNAINTNFVGSTASLDAAGNLVVQANNTGPSNLSVSISDAAGDTGGSAWGNHNMGVTTTGQDGDTVKTGIQIYDPQGNAHNLNLVFQKQANNSWSLTAQLNPGDGSMTDNLVSNINFNQDGSFDQVTGTGAGNATMTAQFNGFSSPQTINFSFGNANGFNGLTQEGGASSAVATGQDGFSSGSLSTVSIGQDGTISGVFTNGQTLAIAQLAIATFANPGALNRVGGNYYSLSSESGPPLIGAGQSGGRGAVEQKQLESSNVDVSLEFTQLIIAQRGFEVNAHVITAADQILQDLANIIR